MVDDFCVQYSSDTDAKRFVNALKAKYPITVDMNAAKYIGINLEWDYKLKRVTLSMPEYVKTALHKFRHVPQQHPQHSPHAHLTPSYGQKV